MHYVFCVLLFYRLSALHHAALNGNVEVISLLLESQAVVDIKDQKGTNTQHHTHMQMCWVKLVVTVSYVSMHSIYLTQINQLSKQLFLKITVFYLLYFKM